jgi:hypothetical protein
MKRRLDRFSRKKSGMTFAKNGHAECPKFAGTEVNQHSGKTLATQFNVP